MDYTGTYISMAGASLAIVFSIIASFAGKRSNPIFITLWAALALSYMFLYLYK